MSQPVDAARLKPGTYPHHYVYRTMYSDMDGFRHLNNGVAARLFEEGRASMNMYIFGTDVLVNPREGLQLLFARVAIDYLRQAKYPGDVEIATGVSRIGRSSWTVVQAAFQDDHCFAIGETVTVKAAAGAATALDPAERERFEAYMLRSSDGA